MGFYMFHIPFFGYMPIGIAELIVLGLIIFIIYKIMSKNSTNHEGSTSTVLTVKNIFLNSFTIAQNNIVIILGASILWGLTIWIPYLNVGTTIGMWALVVGLSKKDTNFSATSIFNAEYRKYMGEVFLLLGFITLGMSMGYMFFIIPGIVISLAWSQAIYLLIDKNLTPLQAIKASNDITYGEKMTMFFGYVSIIVVLGIVISLIITILVAAELYLIFSIFSFCAYIIAFSVMVSSAIYIYDELSNKLNN